jgi:hypothetical protein
METQTKRSKSRPSLKLIQEIEALKNTINLQNEIIRAFPQTVICPFCTSELKINVKSEAQ